MSRIFTAELSELKKIILYIVKELESLRFDNETVNTTHVICDEIITNVIKNAYIEKPTDEYLIKGCLYKRPLQISCNKKKSDSNRVSIIFTDWGSAFDPLKYEGDSRDQLRHGGYGIHIAVNLAECIKYKRENSKNILTVYMSSK
ncbi:ATP-binding protein [bacterium]|nr:ATP-binding protein [bacterium]